MKSTFLGRIKSIFIKKIRKQYFVWTSFLKLVKMHPWMLYAVKWFKCQKPFHGRWSCSMCAWDDRGTEGSFLNFNDALLVFVRFNWLMVFLGISGVFWARLCKWLGNFRIKVSSSGSRFPSSSSFNVALLVFVRFNWLIIFPGISGVFWARFCKWLENFRIKVSSSGSRFPSCSSFNA